MSKSTLALTSLSLSMLLSSLDTSIANVALPALAAAFHASFQPVQWIVLAYLLAVTALIVSAGRLGDVLGRRRLFLAGIFTFTASSVLCGLAPSLRLLIAARALQGTAAAVMMALTVALVSETVPAGQTGRAMGLLGTMSAVGTALGPSLGGLLIAQFGWRSIFLINAPLGLAALLLAARYLPFDCPAQTTKFDHAGTLLLAITLGSYALAVTTRHGHADIRLLLFALIAAIFFIAVEAKTASPLLRLEMLRETKLSVSLAMSAIVSTVMMATLVTGPFYLSRTLGLGAARVGLVMSAGPLVAALTGIPAGRLADRFGTARMTAIGLAGIALGAFAQSLMPAAFGVAGYILPIIVMTSHYALFQTANNTAIMSGVRGDQRGVISGMLSLSRNAGLITGASVMGAVFAATGL